MNYQSQQSQHPLIAGVAPRAFENEPLAGGTRVGAVQMAMVALIEEAKGVLNQHSELWKRLQRVSSQEPDIKAHDTCAADPSTGCEHGDQIMEVVRMLQTLRQGLDYQLRVLEV